MKSTKTEFEGARGQKLAAQLDLPVDGKAKSMALFAHCFTCGKDLIAAKNISRALTAEGIGVLRFDFTGIGQSEGSFEDSSFSQDVDDIVFLVSELAKQELKVEMLIGHSLGGAAVVHAVAKLPQIKALITIGAPASPNHVTHLFESAIEEIEEAGSAKVLLAGRPFTVGKKLLDDLREQKLAGCLNDFKGAYLNLHAPEDSFVSIDNATALFKMAHHPKSYISLDGMDHLLSKPKDSLRVGKLITTWVDAFILEDVDLASSGNEDHEAFNKIRHDKDQVAALIPKDDGFTTLIKMGEKHRVISDEPLSLGGNDLGPNPYELLSAGLAACTAITVKMYAQRKKWPLEDVHVTIEHTKIVAPEEYKEAAQNRKIDYFKRLIRIEGAELDADQRARLLDIADKCPVHRTLHMPVVSSTEEVI